MAGGAAKSCFQSGDRVVVQFADAGWCPGVVSARSARRDGKGSIYKVTFDDGEVWNDVSPSDMEYEEDIHAVKRRKRSCIMQPTGAANSDSNQEAEATVEPAASHGDRVIARDSRGNWCEGKVVDNDEDGNRVKVHFKGWGSRWDEWIDMEEESEDELLLLFESVPDEPAAATSGGSLLPPLPIGVLAGQYLPGWSGLGSPQKPKKLPGAGAFAGEGVG